MQWQSSEDEPTFESQNRKSGREILINETDNHVAWVLLIDELDEAREHLTELTNRMYHDGRIDESEYAVRLGHIYAHLNRAWNRRHLACDDPTDAEGERLRRFPEDLPPVG